MRTICIAAVAAGLLASTILAEPETPAPKPALQTEFVVTEAKDQPVADARVRILAAGDESSDFQLKPVEECTTGRNGSCTIEVPATPGLWIEVEKEGYVRLRRADPTFGRRIPVRLERPAAIEGIIVDEAGRPVSSFELLIIDLSALEDPERVPVVREPVKSAAGGRFRLEWLPAGVYTLAEGVMPAASRATLAEPVAPIVVEEGLVRSGVVVRVVRHGGIGGLVAFPAGISQSISVTPVPVHDMGTTVVFDRMFVEAMTRPCEPVSETECRYRIEGLAPGWYRVEVGAEGYGPFLGTPAELIEPARIANASDLFVPTPVLLTARLTDEAKQPIAGMEVSLHFPGIPLSILDATTSKDGEVQWKVSPGTYELDARHRSFESLERKIVVSGELPAHRVDVVVPTGRRIDGFLLAGPGRPMAGVEVVAERVEGGYFRSAQTDSKGHFEFFGVLPGKYSIAADLGALLAYKKFEVTTTRTSVLIDASRDVLPIAKGPDPGTAAD